MPPGADLVHRMLQGDRLALARLITLVENRSSRVPEIMREIYPRTGRAYSVGLTGPPGAGKSSLADRLTALLRGEGATVGIVAGERSRDPLEVEDDVPDVDARLAGEGEPLERRRP